MKNLGMTFYANINECETDIFASIQVMVNLLESNPQAAAQNLFMYHKVPTLQINLNIWC